MRHPSSPWLALLALSVSTPALAGEPAAPPATGADTFHIALIEVPATAEQQRAAAALGPRARAALASDGRFTVISPDRVTEARAAEGVAGTDLSYPAACRVGRAVGAQHVILLGGYDMGMHTTEKRSELKRALGVVAEGSTPSAPAPRPEIQAWATASLIVMDMKSCAAREQIVIRARHESQVSELDAQEKVQEDFGVAVRATLQKVFPLSTFVRTPRGQGGVMSHGARHGVHAGQYYEVHRGARLVGHVHVDGVAEDSARVSLVRGVHRLQPGDRLIERDPMYTWEMQLAATPSLLPRQGTPGDDDAFGVAPAVRGMLYQMASNNAYGLVVERLQVTDLVRWRGGLEYTRRFPILPRRLLAYARLGVGVFTAHQPLLDENGAQYDGGTARSFEILNGLGLATLLGDWLALDVHVSYPLPVRDDQWFLDSNDKHEVPAEALIYARAQARMPALSLGVSVRF
jgi:hypothetical protein